MKAIFGGTIAIVLLGIYVYLIGVAYLIVDCGATAGCTKHVVVDFNDVMAQSLNTVAGLVSALVIAELAITQPGQAPAARLLADNANPRAKTVLAAVTVLYVLVWLVAGLAAFLKSMHHPKLLQSLTDVGQAWLGLAVAAAYAYFGLKPK